MTRDDISIELCNLRAHLKRGTNRASPPEDYTPAEVEQMLQRIEELLGMRAAGKEEKAQARHTEVVNAASSIQADTTAIRESMKPVAEFFSSVGGAGSSGDLRVQSAILKSRATELAKKEKANERKKDKVKSQEAMKRDVEEKKEKKQQAVNALKEKKQQAVNAQKEEKIQEKEVKKQQTLEDKKEKQQLAVEAKKEDKKRAAEEKEENEKKKRAAEEQQKEEEKKHTVAESSVLEDDLEEVLVEAGELEVKAPDE